MCIHIYIYIYIYVCPRPLASPAAPPNLPTEILPAKIY